MNRKLTAALTLALAACGGASSKATIGMREPASVAVFDGVAPKNAGVSTYLAVANSGHDELVLIDPVDDKPVMAPILVRSLVVPTLDPRPALVVSADLADDLPVKQADLLVAVSSGSTALQLVQTWAEPGGEAAPRVISEREVDLGWEIQALVAMPVPESDGQGGLRAASGKARVVAALTGARLAVVEYARQPDGSIAPSGAPVLQDLRLAPGEPGFDAVSLAWDPADLGHLYAASTDAIPAAGGAVEGVAQLDIGTTAPGAWTWRALDARAPTRLVAAWTLRERRAGAGDDFAAAFGATAVPRVYAYLDPARCGTGARVPCGVAVLDPVAGGLVPDVTGRMPYLSPIGLPAIPTGMAISGPPSTPPSEQPFQSDPSIMKVLAGSTRRGTTAVMALPATDGNVYYADLGRWEVPTDDALSSASTRTAVTSGDAIILEVLNDEGAKGPQSIGFWRLSGNESKLAQGTTDLVAATTLTPGFTTSETWTVTYQGVLPGLELRPVESGATDDGRTWLRFQVSVPREGGGEPRATQVARIYDPELGVRVSDFVRVRAAGKSGTVDNKPFTCPDVVGGRVAEFLLPEARWPGGAIVLDPPTCGQTDAEALAECQAERTCIESILRSPEPVTGLLATVRGTDVINARSSTGQTAPLPGTVVVGSTTGYAGRAPIVGNVTSAFEYRLEYPKPPESEDTLAAACPLMPWPYPPDLVEVPAPAVADCRDATCRATCEAALLARKARRTHHLSQACSATDTRCQNAWPVAKYPFPDVDGPVIAFRVGLSDTTRPLVQDLQVAVVTRSGITFSVRSPASQGGAPAAPRIPAAFDRSTAKDSGGDSRFPGDYRFFVPYADGHLYDFSPAQFSSSAVIIR